MKFLYSIFICLFFLLLSPQASLAAEGDLIWSNSANYSAYGDGALGVAADDSGIYVVGVDASFGSNNGQWRVEKRSKSDGVILWSKTLNLSIYDETAWGVAVDNTGVYIVGEDFAAGLGQWHMEKRSLVDGALIWTQVNNFSNNREIAYKVEIDSTGVYIVGYDEVLPSLNKQWRMQKRDLSTGALIWNQVSNPAAGGDEAKDVAIDSSGIYITGTDGAAGWQMRIEKRNLSTGALIWSQVSNPTTAYEYSTGVAVDSTGVYVAGYDTSTNNNFWRAEKRNLSTGALIWNQVGNASTYMKIVYGAAIDSSGFYLIGQESSADPQWRIEKRNLTTGLLEWNKVSNPSPRNDYARDVAVDNTGIYIAGHDDGPGSAMVANWQWRVEKREAPVLIFSGPIAISWTDPTITANTTKIRKVHIDELRTWIDNRRVDAELPAYSWTDPTITADTTKIRKIHFDEMRTAISQVYTACGGMAPTWTDPTLTANSTKIRVAHLTELRNAAANTPICAPVCQSGNYNIWSGTCTSFCTSKNCSSAQVWGNLGSSLTGCSFCTADLGGSADLGPYSGNFSDCATAANGRTPVCATQCRCN